MPCQRACKRTDINNAPSQANSVVVNSVVVGLPSCSRYPATHHHNSVDL